MKLWKSVPLIYKTKLGNNVFDVLMVHSCNRHEVALE